MTLSNFDWTDKDSVKWFILLPTGHEGPYSLTILTQMQQQKKIASDVKIWAEGLTEAVTLKQVLAAPGTIKRPQEFNELPPLPIDLPPVPIQESKEVEKILEDKISPAPKEVQNPVTIPVWSFLVIVAVAMLYFTFDALIKNYETFRVDRLPKMSVKLHERILSESSFGGWNKKIFFKEYLPDDHGQIWLVSSGFQKCDIEASFNSLKDKMLSLKEEKISFKTNGKLKNHIVEFSSFDFSNGSKIVPGLYEMDVRAINCKWDGVVAKLMNAFRAPDAEYVARTKVVLFSKGAEEFNKVLDRLINKKMELTLKEQSQNELFWQDLQQKLETLQAITLQIEQLFLDHLGVNPGIFTKNVKVMIDKYTKQFGTFLTTFVVENENYFKSLNPDSKSGFQKRNYEMMVRLTTKRIGLESMKFIEEFQNLKKKPTQKELDNYSLRVKKVFSAIKADISQKIIQVSDDRSK